ncbi:MAG: phosphatidate cytidylyltransferase [Lachnospiraceae bacterium]|nr:phosphatidate cytidylyltransferase [Lachnospiraceae bacterium]
MFVTRLISGIVLMVAAIFLLFFGGVWLAAVVGVLSLIGVYELLRVLGMEKHPLAVPAYLFTAAYYVLLYLNLSRWSLGLIILNLVVMLIIYVLQYPRFAIEKVAGTFFACIYVSVMLSAIYQTRCLNNGHWLVWLIIIGAWGSDTCAYLVGMLIGKHHFSELSPKKTVEGCVGGVLGAGLIGFIYSCFFPYHDMFVISPMLVFSLVAMVSAVISQFGDLAASAIKRNFEVKDYGNLIPGHGGILDRFDSVIFVAPFVYYLLVLTSYIHL